METQVLIIGGGITGAGIARDLSLRGVSCIVAEKNDINAGASGSNHGLLHSGARYVSNDPQAAQECRREGARLKRLAPDCIEDTGGLFAAVQGDDENYIADFPGLCRSCGIPVTELSTAEALEMEPALSGKLIAAYLVPDASIDPFKLTIENLYQAMDYGCRLLRHAEVTAFHREKGRIVFTEIQNSLTGERFVIHADQVINASGAWSKNVAALAGSDIDLLYSKGSLLVAHTRLTQRVINRLRPSANADILVPGGTVSILGTTSIRIESLDEIYPTVQEIDFIVGEGAAMIPRLETMRYIRAYAGVRPLIGSHSAKDDRKVSRGFALLSHEEDGLENFATITGGKLTTYRLMAEKAVDFVCHRLGVSKPCSTKSAPLPSAGEAKWTQPGLAAKEWMRHHTAEDMLLCECEMVPKSTVNSLIKSIHDIQGKPDLMALGVRSRIGKGSCQGTFCSLRIAAYLYSINELNDREGLESIQGFISERWRGIRPLLWDIPLIQAELQEALYCGLFGIELNDEQP
ncbi:MAG: anaerobic glycerol-3-phosphate dehydrogenase subunit GlpA [Deltaproteobacteria bacterium]